MESTRGSQPGPSERTRGSCWAREPLFLTFLWNAAPSVRKPRTGKGGQGGRGFPASRVSRGAARRAEWKHLGPPVCPVAADRNGQNCEDSAGARSAEPRPLPRPFAAPPPLPVRAPPRGRSLLPPPLECRLSQDNRKKQVILLCRPPLRARFFFGGESVLVSLFSLGISFI